MTEPAGTHDYESAASQLGVSASWLKKHRDELPRLKFGRVVRFTDEHLAEIRRAFEQRPVTPAPAGEGLRPARRRRAS